MAISEKDLEAREEQLFRIQGSAMDRFCNSDLPVQDRASYAAAIRDLGEAFRTIRKSRGAGQ